MLSIANINPLVRAIGVISAVAILVAGITMASFTTNTVAIEGTTLNATSDNLQIYDGVDFGTTAAPGFTVTLNPGVESAKQPFFLKNTSGVDLKISVGATVATNPDVNPIGVKVTFYNDAQPTNNSVLVTDLAALTAGTVDFNAFGNLNPNAEGNGGIPGTNGNYHVTFTLDPDEVTGPSPSVTGLDLQFVGTSID